MKNCLRYRCKLGKFAEAFNNARNNDIKAINKSIENVGRKHHAVYMTNMMFADDIDINHRLLMEIQDALSSFYKSVSENYLIKKNARDMLEVQCRNEVIFKQFNLLASEQLFEIVYQQAMMYYFRIDVKNESDFSSYFDEAIQYRIMSNFMQSDVERILIKMYEDIEIVIEDTKNIEFLIRNYKKLNGFNDEYYFILEQLVKSIRNVILQDSRFEDEYFGTVREISFVLHQNFCGG